MLTSCCNPECYAPFQPAEGRLVRFCGAAGRDSAPDLEPAIQHFWLCGNCAERFVFERNSGTNVKIRLREAEVFQGKIVYFVSAA